MTTIVTRAGKGTALTFAEGDANFTNLNTDKIELTNLSVSTSGDGSLSYNSTTGAFTYTGPGTTQYRAAFSAGTGISISSGVISSTITQGITDLVQDTTPQLGGNLDVNGQSIVSVSNGNITIAPNGTGSIVLDGLNWPQSDGTNGQILRTNGTGQLSFYSFINDNSTTGTDVTWSANYLNSVLGDIDAALAAIQG